MEIIEYVHIFQQIKSLLQSKPIKIVCSSHYRHSKLKWCCLKVLLKHNVIYIIYSRMKNIVLKPSNYSSLIPGFEYFSRIRNNYHSKNAP